MTQPASVVYDGTDLVLWVPAIADIDYPALSELQDATVLDMSCRFSADGWNPQLSEASVTDNRLCSSTDYGAPGRKSYTIPLVYTFNPESVDDDEARLTLTENSTGYFVERPAVAYDTAIAAWDWVRVYSVKLGRQHEAGRTANGVWLIQQQAYLRAPGVTSELVAVIAS